MLAFAVVVAVSGHAGAELTQVDDRDSKTIEASASRAFHQYLEAVDAGEIDQAAELALDPGDMEGRDDLIDRLIAFMRGRQNNPVRNEAMIVRCSGDWAMVVYQYETTIGGKTARVITTAWMIQWEGYWRQFIIEPVIEGFWDGRRTDYELLQKWFDENAQALIEEA